MEIITYLLTFALSVTLLIIIQKYFLNNNIIDSINTRSSHITVATRSGGLAIYLTILLISSFNYIQGVELYDYSILIPLSILLIVGLYDDVYEVDFKLKFVFQIITAKIIIDSGLIIDNFHGVFGINDINRVFAQAFTIFVIVGIINSINFIDGIDGLAASIVGIFIILYEFFSNESSQLIFLTYLLVISLISFIYFNLKSEKKIFLGDSGSLFFGGIVSIYVLNILSSEYLIKPIYDINKILFLISILSYPIIDMTRVIVLRILNNKSPFLADKNHIHHLLLEKFKSQKTVLFLILTCSIFISIFVQILN